MKSASLSPLFLAALVGLGNCVYVQAATTVIAVSNFSFEADGNKFPGPLTGWEMSTTNFGVNGGGTDGSYKLWIDNAGYYIYQNVGEIITEGTTYQLTVDVRNTGSSGNAVLNIELYGSALGETTPFAANPITGLTQNVWATDQTTSFTATAGQAGQTLGIRLLYATKEVQANFDNVRLTATAIPEPSTALLGGLGVLLLLRRRR